MSCSVDGTYDSGMVMLEAIGFSKWTFQLRTQGDFASVGPSGWSVTVYGTVDPQAYTNHQQWIQFGGTLTQIPASSWVPIPAPATEDTSPDVYAWHNPLTATGQALYSSAPWAAIRVVAIGSGTNGAIDVLGFAVP